jgi:hypothetical protein
MTPIPDAYRGYSLAALDEIIARGRLRVDDAAAVRDAIYAAAARRERFEHRVEIQPPQLNGHKLTRRQRSRSGPA